MFFHFQPQGISSSTILFHKNISIFKVADKTKRYDKESRKRKGGMQVACQLGTNDNKNGMQVFPGSGKLKPYDKALRSLQKRIHDSRKGTASQKRQCTTSLKRGADLFFYLCSSLLVQCYEVVRNFEVSEAMLGNWVGGQPLVEQPTSHTTVYVPFDIRGSLVYAVTCL